ncbi:hypothetical protein [Rhodococcus koreensis]
MDAQETATVATCATIAAFDGMVFFTALTVILAILLSAAAWLRLSEH